MGHKQLERDPLGNLIKGWESSYERTAQRGMPLVARLDGRSFHTWTSGLNRPYDIRFQECMISAATSLLNDLTPIVAYVQSDEITICWNIAPDSKAEYPFGGRIQKLASVLASIATNGFNEKARRVLPQKPPACFDARIFQVPGSEDLVRVLLWRENDAVKNSVSMLAQSVFSHKELHGVGTGQKIKMLEERGIKWADQPSHFKKGLYLKRNSHMRALTDLELQDIPANKRPAPGTLVQRSTLEVLELDPLHRIPIPEIIKLLGLAPKTAEVSDIAA
jgi:tRNA(His) 5'-end guanylyltransferase